MSMQEEGSPVAENARILARKQALAAFQQRDQFAEEARAARRSQSRAETQRHKQDELRQLAAWGLDVALLVTRIPTLSWRRLRLRRLLRKIRRKIAELGVATSEHRLSSARKRAAQLADLLRVWMDFETPGKNLGGEANGVFALLAKMPSGATNEQTSASTASPGKPKPQPSLPPIGPADLIDSAWIRKQRGDANLTDDQCAVLASRGEVSPNALFDLSFYRKQAGLQPGQPLNIAQDFFDHLFSDQSRSPNPLFSVPDWLHCVGYKFEQRAIDVLLNDLKHEMQFTALETRRRESKEIVISDQILGSEPAPGQEICLFVHYDARDAVQECVLDYLELLATHGFAIVFLTNSNQLSTATLTILSKKVWRVICTDNRAYDWGLYRIGLETLGDSYKTSPLLFANDSVVATLAPWEPLLTFARSGQADIAGAIDSELPFSHLQSFFLYCHPRVHQSDAWEEFWKQLRPHDDKWFVILSAEVGFSRWMSDAGYRVASHWKQKDLYQLSSPSQTSQWRDEVLQRGLPENPTVELWDLLLESNFPFLKRSLLRPPVGSNQADNLPHLANVISRMGKRTVGAAHSFPAQAEGR